MDERDEISERVRRTLARAEIEHHERWHDYTALIPWLSFPAGWQVQMIPPFAGAMARFRVRLPDGSEKSVYFDAHDALGCYGEPYWEVHPVQGDTARCAMNETEELIRLLGLSNYGPEVEDTTDEIATEAPSPTVEDVPEARHIPSERRMIFRKQKKGTT